jgi:hypothetical protein
MPRATVSTEVIVMNRLTFGLAAVVAGWVVAPNLPIGKLPTCGVIGNPAPLGSISRGQTCRTLGTGDYTSPETRDCHALMIVQSLPILEQPLHTSCARSPIRRCRMRCMPFLHHTKWRRIDKEMICRHVLHGR